MRIILKAGLRIADLRFELTTFLVNHTHIQKQWFLQAEKNPKKQSISTEKKKKISRRMELENTAESCKYHS